MKKIYYIGAIALLSMASCKKEFLEREPRSTVIIDALYKTDKDFNDAVIGCYTPLQAQYQVFWVFGDLRGDDSRHEVLANLSRVAVDVVKNKDRYKAEAKFLRALAYFDLVRIFGDVPMITKPISTEEAYKTGRDKVDKIYDEVIIKDLMAA